MDERFVALLQYARALLGARTASFFQIDSSGQSFVLDASSHGLPARHPVEFRCGEGILGTAARTGRAYICRDPSSDPNFAARPMVGGLPASLASIPIKRSGRLSGVLNLSWDVPLREGAPGKNGVAHLVRCMADFLRSFRDRDPGPAIDPEDFLETARRLQASFTPTGRELPSGLEVETVYRPLHPVGGDLVLIVERGPDCVLAVGDVSGHDVGSALGMAMVQGLLRREIDAGAGPAEILERANRTLKKELPAGWFVTLMVCEVSPSSGLLTYAGAGHPHGLLHDPEDGTSIFLESEGGALGMGGMDFREVTIPLKPEAVLALYTDGLEDVLAPGRTTGRKLLGLLRESGHRPLSRLRSRLDQILSQEGHRLRDDLSIVLARPTPEEPSAAFE